MVMRVGQDVGNYRLLSEISHGETAIVYQAVHHIMSNRLVALKLLYKAQLSAKDEQEDFFREARLLATLQHPHILPLIDADIHEGLPYIITAFAAQGSLRSKLNHRSTSPLPIGEALAVLRQVGEALHFAHQQNIVHSDVKPENILFLSDTEAVLADFDIARTVSKAHVAVQSLGGTSAYMAPEQFQGKVRKESDQYSLGCIAYELLTGKRPFRGEDQAALMHAHLYEQAPTPTQVYTSLPAQLDAVILKALAKKYADRYADIPSFLNALNAAVETGKPQRRSPLILKDTHAEEEDRSTIYYEKTELNSPADEVPPIRKRRTTKTIADKKTASVTKARTTSSSKAKGEEKKTASISKTKTTSSKAKGEDKKTVSASKARTASSSKAKDDQPKERKKISTAKEQEPVKRVTSTAKAKLAASKAVESKALSSEKKVRSKTHPASITPKISVDKKQGKETTHSVHATKKPDPVKPPVATKRASTLKKKE